MANFCCCRPSQSICSFPFSILLLLIIWLELVTAELALREPKIAYVDGANPWDDCRPNLRRTLATGTGMLLSHPNYGSRPYNASRNCFLTLVVPLGYRIRLKALDFDVQGRWKSCEHEDTLHVFDHDQPMDPASLAAEEPIPITGSSPGKILGEYCGKMPPAPEGAKNPAEQQKDSLLAESTHNTLTIWWHTEKEANGHPRAQQNFDSSGPGPSLFSSSTAHSPRALAQGFRLLWSAFRPSSSSAAGQLGCNASEFKCKSGDECLPAPLGCNSHADCLDSSDLDPLLQLAQGCDNVPSDPVSLLFPSGPGRLLFCAAVVLFWTTVCFGCCCCLVHHRRRSNKKRNSRGLAPQHGPKEEQGLVKPFQYERPNQHQQQKFGHPPPLPPPQFSPPQVPGGGMPAGGAIQPRTNHPQQQRKPSSSQSRSQGSSSHSSSSRQQQQTVDCLPAGRTMGGQNHQKLLAAHQHQPPYQQPGSSTDTTATNNQSTGAGSGGGGEYFYVQPTPSGGGDHRPIPPQQHGGGRRQHLLC